MTLMLASVANLTEAELALAGGADIIDLKDPSKGALGALDAAKAAAIVKAIGGRKAVSAAAGDKFASPEEAVKAAEQLAASGVDYVKVGLAADGSGEALIRALGPLAARVKLVGVLFADQDPDLGLLLTMAECGFSGAMLDTAAKGRGRLLDYMDVAALARFVDRRRAPGLMLGLAGSLEAPDAPRLLPLGPDFLGFRGALCKGGAREAALDPEAIALLRDLIPHESGAEADNGGGVDWRLFGRGYVPVDEATETDRIFVHDFILPCFIGAYDFERAAKQDVRFNIDIDVARVRHADDMRDILSYDLIVDAIRIITGRGHIELVETLARDIADSLLRHPAVVSLTVRVEKLDVIRGAVGVEIARKREQGRPAMAAAPTPLAGARSPRSPKSSRPF